MLKTQKAGVLRRQEKGADPRVGIFQPDAAATPGGEDGQGKPPNREEPRHDFKPSGEIGARSLLATLQTG
jgi:hypothetical protein